MRHFYQPEQPFDRNLARYTRKVRCLEAPDFMPDDGTKKIFLYTFGDSRGESPEMVRFLKYLQNPSNTAGDTLLEEISRAVQYEKQSPRAKGLTVCTHFGTATHMGRRSKGPCKG